MDIATNGQRLAIELLDGKILDGRRRYTACRSINTVPKTTEVKVADPVAYVMSLNLHRRHLTPGQRSMIAARARAMYDAAAKERMQAGKKNPPVNVPEGKTGDSRDAVGKSVGVSGKYVDYATKVIANAVPEVVKAVDEGRMNVKTAAVLSSEPPDVQRDECAKPKRNRTYHSVSAPLNAEDGESPEQEETREVKGVGITRANEAINSLTRIPKNDALRKRGFQLVTDWIRRNS